MYSTWVHNTDQPFQVFQLQDVDDFLRWQGVVKEGWEGLTRDLLLELTYADFATRVLRAALAKESKAAFFVYASKNGKPLGFSLVEDNTEVGERPVLLIYAAYSNGKYKGAANASITFVGNWARLHGYKAIQLYSKRTSGSAMRLFRKKLGFVPVGVTFEKGLE